MTTAAPRASLPVPEPDLTPAAMRERMIDMRQMLRDTQAECEAAGRLPEHINQAFVDAGFFRVVQPRRFGGYEFDLPAFLSIMIEAARGCPSCGWTLCLTSAHTHTFTLFSEDAQAEAYGDHGNVRAPFVAMPGGVLQPADGGYMLSGQWDYSSGCDISTHFFGTAMLPGPDMQPGELPAMMMILIPRSDFTIIDNWDVMGMRGTGSKRVVVKDVFVPEDRVRPGFLDMPPARPEMSAFYNGRLISLLMSELAAVAVGAARGALDEYEELMRTRKVTVAGFPSRFEWIEYQHHYGHAASLIETAESALMDVGRRYMEYAELHRTGAEEFSQEKDMRLLLVEQQVARIAGEAVDLLFRTAGSSAAKRGERMERIFRDMNVVRTHMGEQYDRTWPNYTRIVFGLPTIGVM